MRFLGVLLLLVGLAGCAATEDAPAGDAAPAPGDWLEIPAGTPVLEYDMLPVEERQQWLDLAADLVIGERVGDTRYSFGEVPPTVAVDEAGRLFVYDADNYRVAVFSAEGEFLYQFGSRGEGPGEFSSDRRAPIGFLGDRLFIYFGYRRLGFWTPQGDYLEDFEHRMREVGIVPQEDGTMMASATAPVVVQSLTGKTGRSRAEQTVARYALTGAGAQEVIRYARAPAALRPSFAGLPGGEAYISTILGNQTQIAAFDRDATVRWITRLQQPPGTPVMPADLLLDGAGRVFVLPRVNRPDEPPAPIVRTIDVLDTDGTHLAALKVPDVRMGVVWQQARGDYVYGVQADPVTYEWQVVRYRLVLPGN